MSQNDVAALKKAMKVMKQKQARTIASDEYEERLKHAERKLKLLENKRETESAPLSVSVMVTRMGVRHQS